MPQTLHSHAMGTLPTRWRALSCNPGKSLQQQKAYFHDDVLCLNEDNPLECFLKLLSYGIEYL